MKKYIVEFIGAFFLVLTIVTAVNGGAGMMAPLAIGVALMVMVYAGGHISGAHYNPAVTLAVFMRGKISGGEVPGYMVSQIAGGILAAVVGATVLGKAPDVASTGMANTVNGLIAEILGTFALCYVVLNTATTKSTEGNSYYGLAIGLTVTCMAYALGGISGGAFNPAVAFGISVAQMASWSDIWVFLIGCFGGGALAAIVFNYVYGRKD